MRLELISFLLILLGALDGHLSLALAKIDQTIAQTSEVESNIQSFNTSTNAAETSQPEIIILAGTPGAGKGHVLKHLESHGDIDLKDYVVIDFEHIRALLPERGETPTSKDVNLIGDKILNEALAKNKKVIFDSSLIFGSQFQKLLEQFKEQYPHYSRKLIFVQTAIDTTLERFKIEYQSQGIQLSEERLRTEHVVSQDNFFSLGPYFNERILIKNENSPEIISIQNESSWQLAGTQIFHSLRELKQKVPSVNQTFNIVFDLDWTLIYSTRDNKEGVADVIFSPTESYKFADGAAEMTEALLRVPGVKISFFSGGPAERNEKILKNLILPSGRSAYDIAYQIRSYDDLERRPGIPESSHFTKRFRKNPKNIDANSENTIIVEDSPQFIDPHQQGNVLWIGNPYEYVDRPELINDPEYRAKFQFLPKDVEDWKRERSKIIWAYGALISMIEAVLSGRAQNLVEANLKQFTTPSNEKAHPGSEAMSKYLTIGKQRLTRIFPGFISPQSYANSRALSCKNSLQQKNN